MAMNSQACSQEGDNNKKQKQTNAPTPANILTVGESQV
ncbi:hypothetical protein JCM19240_805 [Vibrio maritimus]|uniref:Uncharacterized protein n=1 Tax=Vibrio maritimus TaxID=990268 RepID=A0A090TS37_9VIBR|nr:hypothetical protein JCM19240_805 [Vibrio maritimus]